MINISKSGNAIKFAFTDSDHYLYGNGEIEVPVNSLSLIVDESNMVTFRKANSNDIFLSFDPANSNLSDKEGVINFYKTNMVGSTGGGGGSESGITSGEVQTMIDNSLEDYYTDDEVDAGFDEVNSAVTAVDNALSAHTSNTHVHVSSQDKYNWNNKAEMSAVTAVANDVSTLSGQVATKVATSDFNAYSAATDARIAEDEEVTAAALNNLDENKQDALVYYSEDTEAKTATIHIEDTDGGTVGEVLVDGSSVDMYASMTEEDEDNGSMVETHSDINGNSAGVALAYEKNIDDAEATHSYLNVEESLISMEVMADEETTNVDVTSTGVTINGENVVTEDQLSGYQPILSAGTGIEISGNVISATGGGGATYSAGTNISIDTANTINCTLNARNGSGNGSLIIGDSECSASGNYSIAIGHNADNNGNYSISIGSNSSSKGSENLIWGANNSITGINSSHCFIFGKQIKNVNKAHNTAFGDNLKLGNNYETSFGAYNNSVTGSTASGQTLFSVGNGTADNARHNAFEIRQNGDIYVNDGTNDVRLQDTILALGGLKFVQCTQAEYDALVSGGTVDSSTIYFITNVVS